MNPTTAPPGSPPDAATKSPPKPAGYSIIAAAVVVLIFLHQDYWFWNDGRLIFGVLPIGMAWHILISLLAAAMWWLATVIAWPLDEPDRPDNGDAAAATRSGETAGGSPE